MAAPTLAQMRAQKAAPAPRPTRKRTVTLIEGQHLLARSKELEEELVDVMVEHQLDQADDGEQKRRPRKAGEKLPPRIKEIKDEQKRLLDELVDFQVELTLTGVEGGDWNRWKEAHPPRPDSRSDAVFAKGMCNSHDLFEDLGTYVTGWDNGEPDGASEVDPGDWDASLAERIMYADRRDLVTEIVDMHEDGVARAPKSLNSSPTTESSATG